ncbi:glycosyltransferase family 39 protein [bacterium]|nr:glycosyltransferase family 39 protein [bacterium]
MSRVSRFLQLVWILLFALILFLYFYWQIPLHFVLRNLAPLLFSLLHLFSLVGLGWPLMRILLKEQSKIIQFFCSLAFGIGFTGIFSFALGLAAHFDPVLFVCWEVIGLLLFLVACASWRPFVIPEIKWNLWNALGAGILLLFLAAQLPFVVAPEISTDAIAYHLLIPKTYLQQGEVYHLPLFVEAYYPSLAEYNYLPLLVLSNEIVCKTFHFWITIAVLVLLGHMVKRAHPENNTMLAPAFFLSMPVTAIHMGWAWNDFLYTLIILLSLYFLISYHASEKKQARDLLIAGILAGLGSWMKYTFVLFFFTSLLLLLLGWWRWRWNVRHYPCFFLGVGVLSLFWMFQNWMFTENPFYPFLNKIFQSPYWTETADRYFHNALRRWEIADWNWSTYFTFPVHIALKPRLVDIHTGILPLVFIPALFLKTTNKVVAFLKWYIAACVFVWLFIHTENRSILTVFAVLFCIASIGLEQIQWSSKRLQYLFAAGILAATTTNFYYTSLTTYYLFDPIRYFLGRETASQYRTRLSESQRAFDYLNSAVDAKRVVLVSIHVPYYLNKPNLFSSFADPPIAEVLSTGVKDVPELTRKFREMQITHVVINRDAFQKENTQNLYSWNKEQRLLFEEFLLKHCVPMIRYGPDYVFRVKTE